MQDVITEITVESGSIFDSGADLLVCPVACTGALDALCEGFKKRWPAAIAFYQNECAAGRLSMFGDLVFTNDNGQQIAFVVVKELWAEEVSDEGVINAFESLTDAISEGEVKDVFSIAIPAIEGMTPQALEDIASSTIGQSQLSIEVILLGGQDA
jgi:hypothetical protein